MVDYINKIPDNSFRVNEAKDATDDEGKKQDQDDEDQENQKGNEDKFDKLSQKTDWNILFDKSTLWDRNIEVKVEDIDRIKILGLNIKRNPALLKIRVFLYDGNVISTAFLSISRSLGLKIKGDTDSFVDVNQLTTDSVLRLTVPTDEEAVDDEITKITGVPKEKTFSQTFRRLVSKRTWIEKLGIQDPVSKRVNKEILLIYVTVLVLLSAIGFVFLLLTS